MAELHDELLALRADWPETPDLVERLLAAEPAPARRRRGMPWKPALAALVAVVAGVMAVEPARSAVLEWLGLKSVKIERREPTATPGPSLRLGPEISAEQARRLLPGLAAPPAALGGPDAIHALGGGLAFVYDGPLLVQRFEARVGRFIEKAVGGGARLERLRVGGDPAYWIEGAHGFAYRRQGVIDFEDQRIAGNTLLVERAGGELLRIEGDVDRARAIEIADSVPR
ncbi:MAG TPA: hypothetical protein VE526_04365 [Solirubrobacteraceae bacterium]|nr:hypothetical protein [Solirubrobacteraceae bacterium]